MSLQRCFLTLVDPGWFFMRVASAFIPMLGLLLHEYPVWARHRIARLAEHETGCFCLLSPPCRYLWRQDKERFFVYNTE